MFETDAILKQKAHTRLGFDTSEKKEIVDALNKLMASYAIFYQELRNFHWNVKGGDFFDIHERFELYYDKAKVNIDDIAERIRVFDARPYSTFKEYLTHSSILEPTTDLVGAIDMVKKVRGSIEILLTDSIDVVEVAANIGDNGTLDLVNTIQRDLEKDHWMLTAFMS